MATGFNPNPRKDPSRPRRPPPMKSPPDIIKESMTPREHARMVEEEEDRQLRIEEHKRIINKPSGELPKPPPPPGQEFGSKTQQINENPGPRQHDDSAKMGLPQDATRRIYPSLFMKSDDRCGVKSKPKRPPRTNSDPSLDQDSPEDHIRKGNQLPGLPNYIVIDPHVKKKIKWDGKEKKAEDSPSPPSGDWI